jgi:hypothetical protein
MKSKRIRRYREHYVQLFVATQSGNRIHDFIKGWGTIHKDGKSVLWDYWRPITKREHERSRKRFEKTKGKLPNILLPMIKATMPTLTAADIVSVQPMMTKYEQ